MTALTLRFASLSARLPRRLMAVNLALLLLLIAIVALRLLVGSYPVDVVTFWAAISGTADPVTQMIVLDHRLPRIAAALGVGLALGVAGEMIQTLLRNPLASPDIIGFSAGASCGAVLTVAIAGSTGLVAFGAVGGGLFAACLVIALSWNRGIAATQIVLIGIGVTLTFTVLTNLLLIRIDANAAALIIKWLIGSFSAGAPGEVGRLWLGLLIVLPLVLWHQFTLDRSALDTPMATGLGIALNRSRLITLGLSVALVALAVMIAGPLPFVAFVAGPIAHGINGQPRPTVMTAGMVGAVITLLADMITSGLIPGVSLPAGILTAMIGAPVLIWVLALQARKDRR